MRLLCAKPQRGKRGIHAEELLLPVHVCISLDYCACNTRGVFTQMSSGPRVIG